jgi:HSP20 family protein
MRIARRITKEDFRMAEKNPARASGGDQTLARQDRDRWSARPTRIVDRFADEMDRLLADFRFGSSRFPATGASGFLSPWRGGSDWTAWAPEVEVFRRNNEMVVRADLPGMKKEDVSVDVTDDSITIAGERRQEYEEDRAGLYRSERSYGSFCRVVPLPAGAIGDQAKANFKNGVLEITMPAPPEQVTRGRRLEITEGEEAKR